MIEHTTRRVIAVHAGTTIATVLDQVRAAQGAPIVIALDALATLFASPDHFRALDRVRDARPADIVFAVDDPHRTGLALAFGYRAQPLASVTTQREPTRPVVTRIGAGTRAIASAMPADTHRPAAVVKTHPGGMPDSARTAQSPPVAPDEEAPAPYHRTHRALHRRWSVRAAAVLIVLAVLIGGVAPLVVMRVHTATIDLYPAEEPFTRTVPFAVSADTPDGKAVPDPNILPAHPFNTTVTREMDVPATGTKNVPDGTATGAMTLRSRADGALTIKAGATIKGPKDVSYVVQSDVVVPGLDFGKGQLGEATAKVRADTPGPAGNLAAGYTVRYTENITVISGEISGGTEKPVTVVSNEDIGRARQTLEDTIQRAALADVNAKLPPGVTPLNDFLTKQAPTVTASPAAGTEAASVRVRMSVPVQIPVFDNSAFQALVEGRVASAVAEINQAGGGRKEVVPNTVTATAPVQLGVDGRQVRFQTEVHGTLRAAITTEDAARIGRTVAGKTAADAQATVRAEPGVGRFTLTYGPAWLPADLRERMPKRASNIAVRIMASG
jgi:hypothetical protein